MGDDKKTATGKDLKYQELKRKNLTFSAFKQKEPPTTQKELWNHAVEYYFDEKYSDSIHVFQVNHVLSEIISMLDRELNPTISGESPYLLGDLNIFTHGRVVYQGKKLVGTEYNLKFNTRDKNNWVSSEDLEKYLDDWIETSPGIRFNLQSIKNRLDSNSTIWYRGCNIGKYKKILKLTRDMFWGIPKVCAYDLRARLSFEYDLPIRMKEITGASVHLILPRKKGRKMLKEGTPEFNNHVICVP